MHFEEPIDPEKIEKFIHKKAELKETIELAQHEIAQLKQQRKETDHHISVDQLSDKDKFLKLSTQSKYVIDDLEMVAYRAETAMANCLEEFMSHQGETRKVLQALYQTDADIIPDYENKTLTVQLHHLQREVYNFIPSNARL